MNIYRPKLTIIKAKGIFKWFKKDKFILEHEFTKLSGDYHPVIMDGLLMAGEKPTVEYK